MFAFPPQAEVNRVVPKTKIYAHGKLSRRVKELFASQLEEVRWKYKLSPETLNLPGRDGIFEIQVFELSLKTLDFDEAVLDAIDRAIPFPILFELVYQTQVRFAASYKRPSEADPDKWVIEERFITDSVPISTLPLQRLPVALDLASLYEQMVRRHISLPARPGETLAKHVSRFNELRTKQKQARQLEARLAREKQFNRKIEVNAALRTLSQEIEALSS